MPASEVRIKANRADSLRSTVPWTSGGNALKHGMTGEGVALTAENAPEVERLQRSFEAELKPSGDLGRTLVRRMALMSVRMDRCVANETATLSERIRQAEADFDADWPEEEGRDDPERERMRVEAAQLALFDPSKEATLARKYEAAAERSFFRSLKELRRIEGEARSASPAPVAGSALSALGSFLPDESFVAVVEALAADAARKAPVPTPKSVATAPISPAKPTPVFPTLPKTPTTGSFDVPFTIGRSV